MDEQNANKSNNSTARLTCFAPLCCCIPITTKRQRQQKFITLDEGIRKKTIGTRDKKITVVAKESKEEDVVVRKKSNVTVDTEVRKEEVNEVRMNKIKAATNAIHGTIWNKKAKEIQINTTNCNRELDERDGDKNANINNCKIQAVKNNKTQMISNVDNSDEKNGIVEHAIENKNVINKNGKNGLKRRVSSSFKRRQSLKMSDNEAKPKAEGAVPATSGSNSNASDSSEVELLLANEEEQEVELSFARGEANECAETSDASPRVAVQQFAKNALTAPASRASDKFHPEGAESEHIPCRRTSMLTRQTEQDEEPAKYKIETDQLVQNRQESSGSSALEVISAEALERRSQRQRVLVFGATAVAIVALSALLIRRIILHH